MGLHVTAHSGLSMMSGVTDGSQTGNVKVLRIPAREVLRDESLEYVLVQIERLAAPSTAFGGPPPP
jgi:hypothetical protein